MGQIYPRGAVSVIVLLEHLNRRMFVFHATLVVLPAMDLQRRSASHAQELLPSLMDSASQAAQRHSIKMETSAVVARPVKPVPDQIHLIALHVNLHNSENLDQAPA